MAGRGQWRRHRPTASTGAAYRGRHAVGGWHYDDVGRRRDNGVGGRPSLT